MAHGAIHRSNEVSNLSIATGETDRSALESKDRQQLATIARALGGKPTARTRKDELVELILELADKGAGAPERDGDTMSDQTTEDAPATTDTNGSQDAGDASTDTGSGDAAPRSSRAGRAAKDDDRGDDGDRDDAPRSARGGRSRAETGDDRGEDAKGDKADRSSAADGDKDADRGDAKAGDGESRSERSGNRGGGRNGSGGGNQGDRNQNRGNQGGGGGQNRGNQGNQNRGNQGGGGGNQGEDAEPGNRKRRRRGRNQGREQEEENVPVANWDGEPVDVAGLLDLRDEGYGFLRLSGALPSRDDVYVSVKQVRQYGLRKGDLVTGASRPANRNEKNPALLRIDTVNGMDPREGPGPPPVRAT